MIHYFGQTTLYLALLAAVVQTFLPLLGYRNNNPYFLACAKPAAIAQFFFMIMAYALLTFAFIINDFDITYVAQNSHIALPLIYRATAVWGAHEGSILLWVVALNIWTMVTLIKINRQCDQRFIALALSLFGIISFCFLCFLIFTSNPFLSQSMMQQGQDLNPLLQDPGFIIHPPILYIGYVGTAVGFVLVLAALIQGNFEKSIIRVIRYFVLLSWSFLTLGIVLGSWWAYRVLGWGGFWFWDPVENASLLPWFAATAFFHLLILSEKRELVKGYTASLAIITFGLSLLGTFLVRSGVLVSAHSFASDPTRGIFLLLMLTVLLTGSLIIYLKKMPTIKKSHVTFSLFSREMGLLINSALLLIAMLTILLGTLYPLIIDALHFGKISVGAPYFNSVMMPLVLLIMMSMGLSVSFNWQVAPLKTKWLSLLKQGMLSLILAMIFLFGLTGELNLLSCFCLSCSLWIIFSIKNKIRFNPGMALAHGGFAILMIGILLSSLLSETHDYVMKPGSYVTFGPYQFYFSDMKKGVRNNYQSLQARFDVTKGNHAITHLKSEKRLFLPRDMVTTKVAIHPTIFRDLYLALGEPLDQGNWSVRIYYKPFIRWIWFGGLMMILGAIFCFKKRAYDVS